jgi:excisionase family DNA binding protein
MSGRLALEISDALVEQIAERAAAKVVARLVASNRNPQSPYLTVAEAAEYLRCKPQRVYDLLSARRLTRHKDGRRVLVARAELDDYVDGTAVSAVVPALSRTLEATCGKGLRPERATDHSLVTLANGRPRSYARRRQVNGRAPR